MAEGAAQNESERTFDDDCITQSQAKPAGLWQELFPEVLFQTFRLASAFIQASQSSRYMLWLELTEDEKKSGAGSRTKAGA
jgi:hypothetical protein